MEHYNRWSGIEIGSGKKRSGGRRPRYTNRPSLQGHRWCLGNSDGYSIGWIIEEDGLGGFCSG